MSLSELVAWSCYKSYFQAMPRCFFFPTKVNLKLFLGEHWDDRCWQRICGPDLLQSQYSVYPDFRRDLQHFGSRHERRHHLRQGPGRPTGRSLHLGHDPADDLPLGVNHDLQQLPHGAAQRPESRQLLQRSALQIHLRLGARLLVLLPHLRHRPRRPHVRPVEERPSRHQGRRRFRNRGLNFSNDGNGDEENF